jgi:hypothetical protein
MGAVISSSGGKIFGQILHSSLGQVNNYESTLGLNSSQFLSNLQGRLNTAVHDINGNLSTGVVIPSIFGINISDIEIHFNDGWAEAGISVSPAFWLRAREIFRAVT